MISISRRPLSESQRRILQLWQGSRREAVLAALLGKDQYYKDFTEKLRLDLQCGYAQKLDIKAERFANVQQQVENGPILLFDVGQHKILCLIGQWLYDPYVVSGDFDFDPEQKFFRRFQVATGERSGVVLELRPCDAEIMAREKTVKYFPSIRGIIQYMIIDSGFDDMEIHIRNIKES